MDVEKVPEYRLTGTTDGSIYIRSCPMERMIPVYLIVSGILGMIHNVSGIVQRIKQRSRETETEHGDTERKPNPVVSAFNSLLICFIFVWFIAGNVWIYSAYNDIVTDARQSTSFRYCDQTLYYYAFWTATAAYVLVGFSCCFIIFGGLCVTCFVRNRAN
ncbi:hypothetical protein FSP39_011295 [Pinctada imbricata]|uniref:Uncharacterized protein n=1 Tax=Pinctada imbricata TaxID=66713 RepID=A0AA89BX95_PINIB|nr:hypothetical protein FSP39_011295 [Pinctada imbricata]